MEEDIIMLYEVPPYDGQDDYLSDASLAVIADHIIAKLPRDGFDVPSNRATRRTATATVAFDDDAGPIVNAERLEAMFHAVTVVRTLHANLVAARAALGD